MPCRPLIERLLWPMLVLASVAVGMAAENQTGPGMSELRVKHWTTDDGLPQNRIGCLKQTRDGYLWIGTWNGLARFDGVKFTVFNKSNTPELVSDAINALTEDSDGTLWMGTRSGLVGYRDRQFQRVPTAASMPDGLVWQLIPSRGGGLWVQSGFAVARFVAGKFSKSWTPPFGKRILSLQEGPDGWLNVFTDCGWLTLSPKADELQTNYMTTREEWGWLAARLADAPGRAWVGKAQGLFLLDQGVWTNAAPGQIAPWPVDMIAQDPASNLWANVKGSGLFRRGAAGWKPMDLGEGSGTGSTVCLAWDLEGSLWIGHDTGLFQLSTPRARAYTTRDGLPSDNVWSVCEAAPGEIWVGTDHGASCIVSNRVIPLESRELYLEARVRCIWPKLGGGVWIAKDNRSLLKFDQGRFALQRLQLPQQALPTSLFEDHSGQLWVGTTVSLLTWHNNQRQDLEVSPAGDSIRDVHAIIEGRNGALWFGVRGALACLNQGRTSQYLLPGGNEGEVICSIHEDSNGALWLGTENGLMRFQNGRFFAFTRNHGLLEDAAHCVLEDDFGFLWLSGRHGIQRIKRDQLNAVADGRLDRVDTFVLGTADGMATAETNGGNQPGGWRARDGRFWFPTGRGVVVFDPNEFVGEEPPPLPLIEQVKADGDVVFGDGENAEAYSRGSRREEALIGNPEGSARRPGVDQSLVTSAATIPRISPGHGNVLEFSYTANTFVAPERARFRYRLVGADHDWREETGERTVRYINLRPGDYRFELTAANHHQVWSPHPAVFAFSLAPHFWQTWSFYVLCGCSLTGLAAAVQGYRLRWQHRLSKLEQQRAVATERTRIARDLHDDLGTALTGLALELDVAGREANESTALAGRLSRTAHRTRDLAERMREVVWTVNPRCDTVSSLASFLEQQVSQFLRADGLKVRLDFPEDIPELPLEAEARHQLALGVREALTNVVRHGNAAEVSVSLAIKAADRTLVVEVKDNGRGFRTGETSGHGLANMRSRMEQIGGAFDCTSIPGGGTTITFRLPIPVQRS
jgi:signal transduction histidine kinase/ligand-binding sensor domain-containing protein